MNEIPSKLNPVTADKPTAPRQIPSNFSLKSTQKSFFKKKLKSISVRSSGRACVPCIFGWRHLQCAARVAPPSGPNLKIAAPFFDGKIVKIKTKKTPKTKAADERRPPCSPVYLEEICIRGPPEKSGARGNQEVLTEKWGKFRNISKIYGRICIIFTTVIVHSLLYGKSFGSKLIG